MGRRPCCGKEGLNRGAWSAIEDAILTNYITTNGEGKWTYVPFRAGLKRCGKSCRLRWLNYLRPGIKRGNITHDEEDLIIRLHKLLGNRWSLIAGRLPGRTDNEIKNYWNSNLSKRVQQHPNKQPAKKPAIKPCVEAPQATTFGSNQVVRTKARRISNLIFPHQHDSHLKENKLKEACKDAGLLLPHQDQNSSNDFMDFNLGELLLPYTIFDSNLVIASGDEIEKIGGVTDGHDRDNNVWPFPSSPFHLDQEMLENFWENYSQPTRNHIPQYNPSARKEEMPRSNAARQHQP